MHTIRSFALSMLGGLAGFAAMSHPADGLPETTIGVIHAPAIQEFSQAIAETGYGVWWSKMPERLRKHLLV